MACKANRPKMTQCLVGGIQKRIEGHNYIHYLPDELLMEILGRLPNRKSIIQCKCVCKRWATLTSHPLFVAEFIELNFAIVMWYEPDRYRSLWQGSESFFRPSIYNAQNASFSPFPFPRKDNSSVRLVASWKDLLLYFKYEKDKKCDYYISNAQTRQWVQLPSPPCNYGNRLLQQGLICDPFCSHDREIGLNSTYRYSVIVIKCNTRPLKKLCAHVFSSSKHCDSQWRDRVLSLPKTCRMFEPCSGFCFEGKLHFRCQEGLFGFDQDSMECDDEIKCRLVKWPVGVSLGEIRLGVSQEHLKVALLGSSYGLRVWILKDYKRSNWMLQYTVESSEWACRDSWMTKKLEMFPGLETLPAYVLGFHPSNSDVIYVIVPGGIFLCNLSSRTLELATCIPAAVAERCKHYIRKPYDVPIMLPRWPTPLPRLSSGH